MPSNRTKKDKQKPRKPKVDLQARMPRPRPITLRGPRSFIMHAREYPFLGCWLMRDWQERGLTPVVVARQQAPDKVIFATILVDIYCLGVKNAYCNGDFPLKKFHQNLVQMCSGEPEPCDI